ncbi:MAG: hypothetical protein U0998_05625 [Moraxellaceae bacterium]|nr:hypothetical protein [Moraxellaceae bacterium]MDZ4386687.1 hypothetical protein [Moraxellaceae bacterium]
MQIKQIVSATDWRTVLWGAHGVTHLVLHSAAEVTDLVAEMDGTIRQSPWPTGSVKLPPRQRAPWPYRLVAGVFRHTAKLLQRLVIEAEITQSHGVTLPVLSALNGVLGDKLEHWQSPLAFGMTLRNQSSEQLAWSELATSNKAKVVLFAHGLCWSEREWQTPAQSDFLAVMQNKGWQAAWLRYNSGRAIWRNGEDLANWLEEALTEYPVKELVLVGHSQGGLLIRSAFEYAREHNHRWLYVVTRAAYLATPHHGAPLERAGNWANALLSYSPYTRPLMRLGNIRSAAIKDLRFGLLTQAHSVLVSDDAHHDCRDCPIKLPDHIHHFMLAGSINADAAQNWIGDGLVPVSSGLGLHARPEMNLHASSLARVELERMDHMKMLADVRVWDAVADWWLAPK